MRRGEEFLGAGDAAGAAAHLSLRERALPISGEMIGAIGFDAGEFDDLKKRLLLLVERVNRGEAIC